MLWRRKPIHLHAIGKACQIGYGIAMVNRETMFGDIRFDPELGLLSKKGVPLAISQRAIGLLRALLSADGQPVSKELLSSAAWPGMIVEEGNLTVQIAALRKTLGVMPDGNDWIVTVPRVGYRLLRADTPERAQAEAVVLPSLAVLPFVNLSGDPEQDYFADGVVEDIITALSRFKSFAVIARNSSFAYKGKAVDVRQVANELGVRYVLEGSVRRVGSKLRISAKLVDGIHGGSLWAQHFDGVFEDIFDLQDLITESVAALVEPKIKRAEIERSRRARPDSLDAYDQYMRSLPDIYVNHPEANRRAVAALERVVALDPAFALGHAMLAQTYLQRVTMQFSATDAIDAEKAVTQARQALDLTRDDPLVLAYGGFVLLNMGLEYETGIELLRLAVNENPYSAEILSLAGIGSLLGGDLSEAESFLLRALRLDPNGLGTHWHLTGMAHICLAQGRYQEALDWAVKSHAINSGYDATHWMLIAANAYLGRMNEARKHMASLNRISPGVSLARIRLGQRAIDPHRIEVFIEGLRMAGLPES
jgi:adenylate cyclase